MCVQYVTIVDFPSRFPRALLVSPAAKMTKAFKLNWHIPVPPELQEGVVVDRWTDVSLLAQ